MAVSFDTNLWSSSGHDTRLETHTDYKSISWRFLSFTSNSTLKVCTKRICEGVSERHTDIYKRFDVLLTLNLSIFILVINQLDAQNVCFTISLFHASTCFEHMWSSSGGQNYIIQSLHEKHDDTRDCILQFWLIVKQTFCASNWLIT